MRYLITHFADVEEQLLCNSSLHTCIIEGKINVLKLFIKHLNDTWWGNIRNDFRCCCNKYYIFSIKNEDSIDIFSDDETLVIINYKSLHDKYINNEYICSDCCDKFNNKANEIINFISKIYNETIDDFLSISPKYQHLCKIYIKVLNETLESNENGIIANFHLPMRLRTDYYDPNSTEYEDNLFECRAEDHIVKRSPYDDLKLQCCNYCNQDKYNNV